MVWGKVWLYCNRLGVACLLVADGVVFDVVVTAEVDRDDERAAVRLFRVSPEVSRRVVAQPVQRCRLRHRDRTIMRNCIMLPGQANGFSSVKGGSPVWVAVFI